MPTSVWRAELSFDGYASTATPNPTGGRCGWWWVGLEAVCLPILDPLPQLNPALDEGNFAIFTGVSDGTSFFIPAPGAFQLVTVRLGDTEVMPPQWQQPFI